MPGATRQELTAGLDVRLAADRQLSARGRRRPCPSLRTVEAPNALEMIGLDEQANGAEEETYGLRPVTLVAMVGMTHDNGELSGLVGLALVHEADHTYGLFAAPDVDGE